MFLYKFCSLSNPHTLSNLEKYNIHLSLPDEFNDPFDCVGSYNHFGTKEEWRLFFADFIRGNFRNEKTPEDILDYYMESLSPFVPSQNYFLSTLPEFRFNYDLIKPDILRLFCVSRVNYSVAMWSHYADSHKGICWCFQTKGMGAEHYIMVHKNGVKTSDSYVKEGDYFFVPFSAVRYSKDSRLPLRINRVRAIIERAAPVREFILFKSKEWEYEQEERMFMPSWVMRDWNSGNVTFNPHNLHSVILGARISKEQRAEVIRIIKERYIDMGVPVVVFQATYDSNYYKVNTHERVLIS